MAVWGLRERADEESSAGQHTYPRSTVKVRGQHTYTVKVRGAAHVPKEHGEGEAGDADERGQPGDEGVEEREKR